MENASLIIQSFDLSQSFEVTIGSFEIHLFIIADKSLLATEVTTGFVTLNMEDRNRIKELLTININNVPSQNSIWQNLDIYSQKIKIMLEDFCQKREGLELKSVSVDINVELF